VVLATRSEAKSLRARRPNMFLQGRALELDCLLNLGKLDEVLSLVDDTLARARASGGKPEIEPHVLDIKCQVLQQRGDLVGAEAACRESVAAIKPTTIAPASREAWLYLAFVLVAEQKLDDARAALAKAEHACAGARFPCDIDRIGEADLHKDLGEFDAQRSILAAMLDAARAAHDDRATTRALHQLARMDYEQLRPDDQCIAEEKEAIAIAEAHPDLFAYDERADSYRMLRRILGDRGRFDEGLAAGQKALDILKTAGDDSRWRFSRLVASIILVNAGRPAEAEQPARDTIAGDSSRDDARAALVDALVVQGKLAEADQVVGELVGNGVDATFARAWLAVHHGKPATAERHELDAQLADLKKRHGAAFDIARFELRIARVAVAAGDPGARKRLSTLADELRKKNLGGLAALADREASAR
jgi:tetratricopeptide (TPR) repeat protein